MAVGKRWTVQDRLGNHIYLSQERWLHIVHGDNHPEMAGYESSLRETIRTGARKQDSLNPRKYRYSRAFDDLPNDNTHIVAIVLFSVAESGAEMLEPNNFITTAYMKEAR